MHDGVATRGITVKVPVNSEEFVSPESVPIALRVVVEERLIAEEYGVPWLQVPAVVAVGVVPSVV